MLVSQAVAAMLSVGTDPSFNTLRDDLAPVSILAYTQSKLA